MMLCVLVRGLGTSKFYMLLLAWHLLLLANLVTTSKAPVTTSVALVTTDFASGGLGPK